MIGRIDKNQSTGGLVRLTSMFGPSALWPDFRHVPFGPSHRIGPGRKSFFTSQYYRDQSKYSPKKCRKRGKR